MSAIGIIMAKVGIIAAGVSAGGTIVESGISSMPKEITLGDPKTNGIKEESKTDETTKGIREIIKDTIMVGLNDIIVDEIKVEGTKIIVKGENKTGAIKEIHVENGSLVPDKGFGSFDSLKKYLGGNEEGKVWYHIVEQSQIKRSGFTSEEVNNVIELPNGAGSIHQAITNYYNSNYMGIKGMTVRDWGTENLKTFEEQFEFGMEVLKRFGEVVATEEGWKFVPFE